MGVMNLKRNGQQNETKETCVNGDVGKLVCSCVTEGNKDKWFKLFY